MFRLISLNINDPNILGHIPEGKLIFVPGKELKLTELPYSSVIIGANGTGKSTLLSYIAKCFEDLKYYKENNKRNPTALNFAFVVTYQIGRRRYKVEHRNKGLDLEAFKEDKRSLRWVYTITINDSNTEATWDNLALPEQVIAVSYLPMDRFRQKRNFPDDYYQYLGLRHRSNAASPQYFLNNTLPLLFNYISENQSVKFLRDILSFMSLDPNYLGIRLEYRYKKFFFTGELTSIQFQDLFENTKKFSKREGTSFAQEYYERYIKTDKQLIKKVVKYLNVRASQDNIAVGEKSLLEFNLFENLEVVEELSLIQHLQKLDLLTSASLLFKKSTDRIIESQQLSSGEFHFLTTMIAIQSTIKKNSLILIDEPDTSLHPNWQMKYVYNLKGLFKKWNSAHFIMATHSHFIISDLEGVSSEVIGITGQVPKIEVNSFNINTYGWSAEEILFKVFRLRSSRNYFFEITLRELLHLLSNKSLDKKRILELQKDLKNSELDNNDPLTKILKETDEYVRNMQS